LKDCLYVEFFVQYITYRVILHLMSDLTEQKNEITRLLHRLTELIGIILDGNHHSVDAVDKENIVGKVVYQKSDNPLLEDRPSVKTVNSPEVVQEWTIIFGNSEDIPPKLKLDESYSGAVSGRIDIGKKMKLVQQDGSYFFSFYNFKQNIKSKRMPVDFLKDYNTSSQLAVYPIFNIENRFDISFRFENDLEIQFNEIDENRYGREFEILKEWQFKYPLSMTDNTTFPFNLRMTRREIALAEERVERNSKMILTRENSIYKVMILRQHFRNINLLTEAIDETYFNQYLKDNVIKVKVDLLTTHFMFTLENNYVIKFVNYMKPIYYAGLPSY